MSSKTEVLAKITNQSTYLGTYVKQLINEVHCEERLKPPTVFKKGDVIRIQRPSTKTRPSVIIKVTKDYVVSIPLTSSESVHCLFPSESRFFSTEGSCFSNSYEVTPLEIANENFLGVFDNMKCLNRAIKELREFINKNI